MKNVITLIAIGCLGVFGFTSTAFAGAPTNFGSGPGCSAIEGVTATSINDGDFFEGRIGTTGVTGFNKNGKPADDADSDGFTDSLEMCISDALHGYCTLVFTANTNIAISGESQVGRNGQQSLFTITFDGTDCASTQCSDHGDNDTDGEIDFGGAHGSPFDTDCLDYDDTSESS